MKVTSEGDRQLLFVMPQKYVNNNRKKLSIVTCGVLSALMWRYDAYAVPLFSMEKPTVTLDLSYEIDDEHRRGPFIDKDQETNTSREKLDIRTRGWVYHPALLVFSLGLKPAFKQQAIYTDAGFEQKDDTDFLGFFVDTTFLQYKPYTLNLYANQDRDEFKSSLLPDNVTESSVHGGRVFLKYPTLPTTITVESREFVFENFFRTLDESDVVRLESRHKTSRSDTFLKTESIQQKREIEGSGFSTERVGAIINSTYNFSRKTNLFSVFNYRDSSSELFDTTTTTASTKLSIRHSPNFRTYYNPRLEKRDEEDFFSDRKYLSAGLFHQLYENLTTTFDVNIDENDTSGGEINTYWIDLNLRYTRRIPWGNLDMNFGISERIDDDKREAVFADVNNERHTLSGTTLVFLDNINIDISSIVVKDITETIIYVEGIDYVITIIGNSIAISRTLFGGIADGQEVLVDYRFEPDPPSKTSTTSETFGVNLYLWSSMLRLYYNRSHSEQDFISGILPDELIDDTVQRMGAELRWKWSTTHVELEDRDTTRTPTERWRIQEILLFRPRRNLSIGLSANYSELELQDTGELLKDSGLNANLRWNIGRTGNLSVNAFSQRTLGITQRSEREGFESIFEWRYGPWNPSVRYTFIDETNEIVGQTRQRKNVFLQVKRRF